MGFIDVDAHVQECPETWSYFDPNERMYGPGSRTEWMVESQPVRVEVKIRQGFYQVYPPGAQNLQNLGARLAQLDDLGIDVQIGFSNFWLMTDIKNPVREAAMARSWNRWMADRSDESGGRLLWNCQVPMLNPQRAGEELRFAREHGAVGIETVGIRHGLPLSDPSFFPVYEQLQDLDMIVSVHVGGSMIELMTNPNNYYHATMLPVAGAYHSIINSDVLTNFPRLRWAFIEAGASWVPAAQSDRYRGDDYAGTRVWGDWRARAREALEGTNLYIAAYIDDDLEYLLPYVGEDRMILGTDYGHLDNASDPDAHTTLQTREELSLDVRRKVSNDNARRLFNIDPNFRPADDAPSPPSHQIMRDLQDLLAQGVGNDWSDSPFATLNTKHDLPV